MAILRHSFNAVAGILVFLASLYLSSHNENVEGARQFSPAYLLLFVVWVCGFTLQFRPSTRLTGIAITLVPLFFLLFSFFFHIERGGLF
ncbi:hypothetical protein KM908_08920 [Alkalihalobacillus clausii]|uniref:hypothetical protein n=1 Tax=Shouchella clausii TaxID=79880 RepID=UPI001C242510|nr:hypothetical protein [Shouchella clausii]MBU8596253.1 hypothetical protein [Shouchella clausii]